MWTESVDESTRAGPMPWKNVIREHGGDRVDEAGRPSTAQNRRKGTP
jgi:hypothetical protein